MSWVLVPWVWCVLSWVYFGFDTLLTKVLFQFWCSVHLLLWKSLVHQATQFTRIGVEWLPVRHHSVWGLMGVKEFPDVANWYILLSCSGNLSSAFSGAFVLLYFCSVKGEDSGGTGGVQELLLVMKKISPDNYPRAVSNLCRLSAELLANLSYINNIFSRLLLFMISFWLLFFLIVGSVHFHYLGILQTFFIFFLISWIFLFEKFIFPSLRGK